MKYLFIDSMSRTGTSLLYQLLYGHSSIYFPPYRMQFVCHPPFAFPLIDKSVNDEEFLGYLMAKTTIVDSGKEWPNITTQSLANLGYSPTFIKGKDALESAVLTLHHLLEIPMPDVEYYCLHDDHSYMVGGDIFARFEDSKVLTTLRDPFEMIASKKNMLVMYVYGQEHPKEFVLSKKSLRNELLRAVFSWWVKSMDTRALAVVYSDLKESQKRALSMHSIAEYLEIPFEECLLSDENFLAKDQLHNELLANGSSLSTIEYLTKRQIKQRVYGAEHTLSVEELSFLQDLLGISRSCFESFESFCEVSKERLFKGELEKQFCEWKRLWQQGEREMLFKIYSALNYGKSNAQSAFVVRGGGRIN